MLVEDPAFNGDKIRLTSVKIQYPETSIQHLLHKGVTR